MWERIGSLRGRDGERGPQGIPGEHVAGPRGDAGRDGRDGRGLAGAYIDDAGRLCLSLTDGSELTLSRVTGRDGSDGAPGVSIKGDAGDPGADGVGIADLAIADGNLVISLTDGRSIDLGRVVGKQGERGPAGLQGVRGETGPAGKDGATGPRGPAGPMGPVGPTGAVGQDGEPGAIIELGDSTHANLTARDIGKLRVREVVIDGLSVRFLALD